MRDAKVQIEEALSRAEPLMSGLSDAQVNWQPTAGAWSVGECLDHLTLTSRKFRKSIEAALVHSRERNWAYSGPAKPSPFGHLFLRILEPPVGFRRVKAPQDLLPQPNRPGRLVLQEYQTTHQEILNRLPEYFKWDQNRKSVQSALPLKVSLGLMLQVISGHCRRHLWQAEQATKMKGFRSG